ncbi:MAG: hypothetical protein QOD87_773 [Pseudonocardiales bacterium]|jgi:hypothetical protein|nr:hypothetical protein [Pseudonocardiales bacterium]
MLHPVGDLAPSVYWRRRLLLAAALVLIVLSAYAIFNTGGSTTGTAARSGSPTTAAPVSSSALGTTSVAPSTSVTATSAAPANCTTAQLSISAATDAKSYVVGDKPMVALVVTNTGPQACVTDLADTQIELRVYSGSARIWGSHDCQVQPGSAKQTLPVGRPTRRQIEWSGLSSQPGCAGVRQRVPAGSYTVSAFLSNQRGKPASFSFTG